MKKEILIGLLSITLTTASNSLATEVEEILDGAIEEMADGRIQQLNKLNDELLDIVRIEHKDWEDEKLSEIKKLETEQEDKVNALQVLNEDLDDTNKKAEATNKEITTVEAELETARTELAKAQQNGDDKQIAQENDKVSKLEQKLKDAEEAKSELEREAKFLTLQIKLVNNDLDFSTETIALKHAEMIAVAAVNNKEGSLSIGVEEELDEAKKRQSEAKEKVEQGKNELVFLELETGQEDKVNDKVVKY